MKEDASSFINRGGKVTVLDTLSSEEMLERSRKSFRVGQQRNSHLYKTSTMQKEREKDGIRAMRDEHRHQIRDDKIRRSFFEERK